MSARVPYMSTRAPQSVRGLDLYETHEAAPLSLLAIERVPAKLWEAACGRSRLTRVLRAAGHDVVQSDVKLWPGRDDDAIRQDFLATGPPPAWARGRAIVTNPPYSRQDAFAAAAINRSDYVALLLRLAFIEGGVGNTGNAELRRFVLDECPPNRIWVFSRRLPMMNRHGWRGERRHDSGLGFAWYVWDGRSARTSRGPEIRRVDWHDHAMATNRRPGQH